MSGCNQYDVYGLNATLLMNYLIRDHIVTYFLRPKLTAM